MTSLQQKQQIEFADKMFKRRRMEELQEIGNKDEWNFCAVILNYKSVFAKQIPAFQGSN